MRVRVRVRVRIGVRVAQSTSVGCVTARAVCGPTRRAMLPARK